jgi:hypothetical protein
MHTTATSKIFLTGDAQKRIISAERPRFSRSQQYFARTRSSVGAMKLPMLTQSFCNDPCFHTNLGICALLALFLRQHSNGAHRVSYTVNHRFSSLGATLTWLPPGCVPFGHIMEAPLMLVNSKHWCTKSVFASHAVRTLTLHTQTLPHKWVAKH